MMKNNWKIGVLGMAFCLCTGMAAQAQTYTPTPENLQARKEFQDNKFGIFLHWGVYSMTARGEWYMNDHNVHRDEYAKLASGFYPSKFDAAEWVSQIKASGEITKIIAAELTEIETKETIQNINETKCWFF